MPPLVTVQFEKKKLKRIEKILSGIPRAMPRVMTSAINKTVGLANTDISKRIRSVLALKAAAIKKAMRRRKANYHSWRGDIWVSKKRLPLIQFGARKTARGTSYKIEKSGGRKVLSHAFIARMPTGHEGVFMRRGKKRLPLTAEKRGPSIGEVFESGPMVAAAVSTALKNLERNIDSQVERILLKR